MRQLLFRRKGFIRITYGNVRAGLSEASGRGFTVREPMYRPEGYRRGTDGGSFPGIASPLERHRPGQASVLALHGRKEQSDRSTPPPESRTGVHDGAAAGRGEGARTRNEPF